MSYSRFGHTWPGGSESWYIYDGVNGKLAIWPPEKLPFLSHRDVKHLRDILNQVLEDVDESEFGPDQECQCQWCAMYREAVTKMSDTCDECRRLGVPEKRLPPPPHTHRHDVLLERFVREHDGFGAELHEIGQILGKALGYPEADETVMEKPDGSVVTGDNTPVTLAMEAAGRIKRLSGLDPNWGALAADAVRKANIRNLDTPELGRLGAEIIRAIAASHGQHTDTQLWPTL